MIWYIGNKTATKELINGFLQNPPSTVSIDIETPTKDDRVPVGISIAFTPYDSLYFPMLPSIPEQFPWHILRDKRITKVFHNAPFDLSVMDNMKYDIDRESIGDTAVMLRLLLMPATLVEASVYTPIYVESAAEMLKEPGVKTMLDFPEDRLAKKCCNDARATLHLYNKYIDRTPREPYDLEIQVIPVLLDMSKKGLLIDQDVREKLEAKYTESVEHMMALADDMGFSISSNQQVGFMLAKRGAMLPFTKSKRQLRADEATLKKYAINDPLTHLVLQYRDESYLLSHYIRPYADEIRAYTKFHLDASTWRVSSTKRNMNNIPKGECRNMFLPDNSVFTDWDYSQLQLRILAYMSQDKRMLYVFETGGSIHQDTANELNTEYILAKSTNFAMVFGGTDETLAETANVHIEQARKLRSRWFSIYRDAADWIIQQQREAVRDGVVRTIYGREIALPMQEQESALQRKAINYPIQGSEAEIAKRALIKCKKLDLRLFLYDEIVIDGDVLLPSGLEDIFPDMPTPITVKKLERWE